MAKASISGTECWMDIPAPFYFMCLQKLRERIAEMPIRCQIVLERKDKDGIAGDWSSVLHSDRCQSPRLFPYETARPIVVCIITVSTCRICPGNGPAATQP